MDPESSNKIVFPISISKANLDLNYGSGFIRSRMIRHAAVVVENCSYLGEKKITMKVAAPIIFVLNSKRSFFGIYHQLTAKVVKERNREWQE